MGVHPCWYFVKYLPDTQKALDELRKREFELGRYNPVMPFVEFPLASDAPAPGAQYDSIDDAMKDSAEGEH
jgi:hypothetical protein